MAGVLRQDKNYEQPRPHLSVGVGGYGTLYCVDSGIQNSAAFEKEGPIFLIPLCKLNKGWLDTSQRLI